MRYIAMLSFVLSFFSFFAHSQVHDKIGQNAWEQCNLKCANNSNCKSECNNTKYFKFTTSDVRGMLLGFAAIQNCTIPDDYQKNFKFENCPPNAEMISKSCLDFNKQMMQSQITSVCTQKRQMAAAEQQRKDGATNSAQGQQPKEESKIDANLGKVAIKAAEQSWKDSKDKSKNESSSANSSSSHSKTDEASTIANHKESSPSTTANTSSSASNSKNSENVAQQSQQTVSQQTQTTNSQPEKSSSQTDSQSKNPPMDDKQIAKATDPKVAEAERIQASGELATSGKDVAKSVSGSDDAVKRLQTKADGGGEVPGKTVITTTAKSASEKLKGEVAAIVTPLTAGLNQGIVPYNNTNQALIELRNQITNYADPSKNACSDAAERAELFCLEGKSPGVKAAKLVMDVATPVIATMNAAQKSCSSTANVTKFVGAGLTVAKGVCVATKFACDSTCGKATLQLKTIVANIPKVIGAAINADFAAGLKNCAEDMPCQGENETKRENAIVETKKLTVILSQELKPEMGTSTGIALKCQGHVKDILSMVANITGLLQASKSARECADQLSTAKAPVTPAQYCDQIANKSSQFCKCQANNNAEGCPGNIAANLTTPNSNTDENGADVKSQGGHSQFAGGMKPVTPDSVNLGGLNSEGSANDGLGDGSSKGNQNAGASFGAGSGSGSGSAVTGNSGESVGSEDKKEIAPEKKKFSFGALFGLGGGSSSSGRSGSGRDSSGGLGEKDMSEIKRKIASEQLRSQISGASGKSNWEKVNERYSRNKATFLLGQ